MSARRPVLGCAFLFIGLSCSLWTFASCLWLGQSWRSAPAAGGATEHMTEAPVRPHRTQPHIVHIVADDIGWNDLGYANNAIHTPHIDALAGAGVTLGRFYAAKECAPTRTSILTGRIPFHYGYYENPSDDGGVPLNYTMLPEVLKAAGYETHALGKWHAGFRTKEHTPTYRGFDTFLGYYHWGEQYVDHVFPPYYKEAKCRGVDFSNARHFTCNNKHAAMMTVETPDILVIIVVCNITNMV